MSDILNSAKRSFGKKARDYGLIPCVDERAYLCGYTEGYKDANDIWVIQNEMLQSKVKELEMEKQTDYPTLTRHQP